LERASVGGYIRWGMHPLGNASVGECIRWGMHPLGNVSVGECIRWGMRPPYFCISAPATPAATFSFRLSLLTTSSSLLSLLTTDISLLPQCIGYSIALVGIHCYSEFKKDKVRRCSKCKQLTQIYTPAQRLLPRSALGT
jgi:hypothetical protein